MFFPECSLLVTTGLQTCSCFLCTPPPPPPHEAGGPSTSPTTLEMKMIVLSHLAHRRVLAIGGGHFTQLHLSNNNKGQGNSRGWGWWWRGATLITLEPGWDWHERRSDWVSDNPTVWSRVTSNPSHLIMRLSRHPGITHI